MTNKFKGARNTNCHVYDAQEINKQIKLSELQLATSSLNGDKPMQKRALGRLVRLYQAHDINNPENLNYAHEGAKYMQDALEMDIPTAAMTAYHMMQKCSRRSSYPKYKRVFDDVGFYKPFDALVKATRLGEPRAIIRTLAIMKKNGKTDDENEYLMSVAKHGVVEDHKTLEIMKRVQECYDSNGYHRFEKLRYIIGEFKEQLKTNKKIMKSGNDSIGFYMV